ncbi:MAG: PQQ-binding-like beta-propeller repeat protein [Verrucomicrobiales bacterium]|nr:PQQ-binding-like beta-propeller repeat protein [Verrucomicrobiales bacterium]
MNPLKRVLLIAIVAAGASALSEGADIHQGNWLSWRGPLQTGESLETYKDFKFNETPVWTDDIAGQGTPVIFKGRLYSWGYRGTGPDLEEVVQARDEKTGEIIWERATHDFLSDTIYNRYSIGAVAIDPETENVIVATTYGLVTCYTKDGDQVWQVSMMERFGRLTFPNGRAGAPVIDGDVCIIRGVTSYWGADGPARDRFFGFDKKTGELLWSSTPGVGPPYLKDTSMSTPYLDTRDGKRVFFASTGCGNIVCVNVMDGTALYRFQLSKGGINSSVVLHDNTIIAIHGKENLDTTEMGRMVRLSIPEDLDNTGGEVDPEQGGAPRISQDHEMWRTTLEMFTSSPLLHEGRIYQMVKTGSLFCVDADTGKILWEEKLANSQLHASPAYADGRLFIPTFPGDFYVINITGDKPVIENKIELEGNGIGSASICNGRVYVHTTEKLYAFEIGNNGIEYTAAPETVMPEAGEAAKILPVPSDVLLRSGESMTVKLRTLDVNGNHVGTIDSADWATFIPPTAKVKAEMDASFEGNTISAADDAALSAGAWKATSGDLSGILRGRVISNLPYAEDFEENYTLGVKPMGSVAGREFDFPPLPWIGARLKWEVIEKDGNKVLSKTLDRVLFQRSLSFIGEPNLSNYTVQADVMTDGSRRIKSVVGLINQRYIISLVGNANILEVSSNHERVKESVPFPISANKWYTLKTRVDIAEDGTGTIRGKAWVKGDPEPEAWTIEVEHKSAHKEGAPGIFGFAPQSQKTVFIDNISVFSND